MQNGVMSFRPFNGHTFMERKEVIEAPNLRNSELKWCDQVQKNNFLAPLGKKAERRSCVVERSPSNLSMSIGVEGETENGSSMYPEKMVMGNQSDGEYQQRNSIRTESVKPVAEKVSQDYRPPSYFAAAGLDLNRREDNEAATSCKQLDLNGFSWS